MSGPGNHGGVQKMSAPAGRGVARYGEARRAFSDHGHRGLFSCLPARAPDIRLMKIEASNAGWRTSRCRPVEAATDCGGCNRKDPQRRCQPLGVGKGAGRSGEGNVDRIDIMSHAVGMIYGLFVKRPFLISQRPNRPGMARSGLNRTGVTFHPPACQARRRPAIP
jgi:hypothetical protein